MKLTKNVHADLRGESKEVIDAMIAVAQAAGFHLVQTLKSDYKILEITFDGDIYVLNHICTLSDTSKKITVNEWLFSNAPDWAVAILKCVNEWATPYSYLFYTGADNQYETIDGNFKGKSKPILKEIIIATRETKKAHELKVGNDVMYRNSKAEILHIIDGKAWIRTKDGRELVADFDLLKPIEPTQEELLLCDITTTSITTRTHSEMVKQLIKLGWLKE